MRIDVSEVKAFKSCQRKWQLSSRNRYHLRPMVPKTALSTGTLFHEALHSMYLGVSLDKVLADTKKEMTGDDVCLLAMIPGYYKNVIPGDLERFKVLDIEHKFVIEPIASLDLQICGSIDMIVVEKETNKVFGFEHKTAKKFREETFLWMDEQPRLYTVALKQYIENLNAKEHQKWMEEGSDPSKQPKEYILGGIYINEVKKLLRDFQYHRTLCVYPTDDLDNFFESFFNTCCSIKKTVDSDANALPSPGYFACQLCDFKSVCETYMYSKLSKEQILHEFSEEFIERESDHLDEKVERLGVDKND